MLHNSEIELAFMDHVQKKLIVIWLRKFKT